MRHGAIVVVALGLVVACGRDGRGRAPGATVPGSVLDGKGDVDPHPPVRVDTEAEAAATGPVAPPPAGLATDAACERLAKLREQRCGWAMRFPPEVDDPAACKRSLDTWVSPETPDHEMLARTIACWALACDAAASCMMQIKTASG
jgi:hypothetical protein